MRKSNTEPLKDVLDRYLKAIGADRKLKEIRLLRHWDSVVGRNIAHATEKIYIDKSILYVKFNSPIAKNEVMMIRNLLVKKMNDLAEEILIKDIRLL
jgi:hypothetical protein